MTANTMKDQIQISVMMALAAMFTLAGYEFIRSASTVLFKNAYGAENLPMVMAAMPVVVLSGVAVYGRILSAIGPRGTLIVTSLGSGLLIFGCYLAVSNGIKAATPVLFLIKELYIVLLIEQYWSYINSNLDTRGARRLNGPITGLAGLGGAAGGLLVGATASRWGTEAMLVVAALSVVPAAFIANATYRRFGEPALPEQVAEQGQMGWMLIRENKILRYLLMIVLLSQLVSAVIDFKFQGLVSAEFTGRPDEETAFQGKFWGTLNSSVILLQFILIPLLMSWLSLRWTHLLMPAVHIIAITVAALEPTVWTVGVAFFLFKAFDYSLFRAAKEILYVPLSFDARYRAKELIDVFGYRTGKGGSSVGIVALQNLGVVMSAAYLPIAFAATAIWLVLVLPLTQQAQAQEQQRNG